MNQPSDTILFQCLERLEDGQSVESILAYLSRYAGELRPILETTRRLEGLSADPLPTVQQHSKADFLAKAATQAEGAAGRWTWPAYRPRWLVPAVAVMLLLLFVGAMIVPASASAVPGDMLYGTKRTIEQFRLSMATSPQEKAQLAESFRQERIREVTHLFGTTRNAQVSFEGTLQSLTGQQWMVEGLPVLVDPTTAIMGSPGVGAGVRVAGRIQDGQLLASEIRVLGEETGAPPTNTPTDAPTLTPTASSSSTWPATKVGGDDCDDDDCDDDNWDDDGLDDDDCDDDWDDDDLDDDDLDDDDLDDDDLDDGDLDDDDLDDDDLDDDDLDDDDLDDDDLDDDDDDDDADDDDDDDDD